MLRRFPSLALLPFVVGGVLLAAAFAPPAWSMAVPAALGLVSALVLRRRFPALAFGCLGVGLMAVSGLNLATRFYVHPPHHLSRVAEYDARYLIRGEVAAWPEVHPDRAVYRIRVDSLFRDGLARRACGALRLTIADPRHILKRGDRVKFEGCIHLPDGPRWPDGFDYRRFLERRGVYGVVYLDDIRSVLVCRPSNQWPLESVEAARRWIRDTFRARLSEGPAALASGFLIGDTRDIPDRIQRAFRDSGTLHLLAVSGSNVALVLGFFALLLRPFGLGSRSRAAVYLVALAAFAVLCYGEPSVLRASVMAALVVLARCCGRPFDLNHIIASAALLILLADPGQLFDVGCQLSFATAWGLILVVPRVSRLFELHRMTALRRWLLFGLIVAATAQLYSAPLVAYYFQRLPLISPVANLAVVPTVSVAVIGSLSLLVLEGLIPGAGAAIGIPLDLLLKAVLGLLDVFGGDGLGVIPVTGFSPVGVVVCYVALVGFALALGPGRVRRPLLIASAALFLAVPATGLLSGLIKDRSASAWLFRVPGGVACAAVDAGAAGVLYLSDLEGSDRVLDDDLLKPALKAAGVQRLDAVFVRRADFDVLDDLLRLAGDHPACTVWAPSALLPALRDAAASLPNRHLRLGAWKDYRRSHRSSEALLEIAPLGPHVKLDGIRLQFVAHLARGGVTAPPASCAALLVVERPAERTALAAAGREGGYRGIVCSGFEQPSGGSEVSPARREGLVDLARVGVIRVVSQPAESPCLKVLFPVSNQRQDFLPAAR